MSALTASSDIEADFRSTVMLLSPAQLKGQRGRLLFRPEADFPLARQIRSIEGAPLSDVFSFVSGLYFRGKVAYANGFARCHAGLPASWVICAGGGLCRLDERVDIHRLRAWAGVSIHEDNPHFTAPLYRHASELAAVHDEGTRFVLLGSIASKKYVVPLLEVFADRLLYPADFAGRGDMSRGSLMLRAVKEGRELAYEPVASVTG